jgi:hypothetical protein
MMGESGGQSVYHGTPSAICRSQSNRSAILRPPAQESGCQFVYRGTPGVVYRT